MEAGFLVSAQSSEYKSPFSFNIIGNMTAYTRNIFGIGTGVEYLGKSYAGRATFTIGGVSWVKEDGDTYLSFAYRYAQTSNAMENYNNLTETCKNSYNRLDVKFGFKF